MATPGLPATGAWLSPLRINKPAAAELSTAYIPPDWEAVPGGARTPDVRGQEELAYLLDTIVRCRPNLSKQNFSTLRAYCDQNFIRSADELLDTDMADLKSEQDRLSTNRSDPVPCQSVL